MKDNSAHELQGTEVSETREFRQAYSLERSTSSCHSIWSEITCYRGLSKDPHWIDLEPDMFSPMCIVNADIAELFKTSSPRRGLTGNLYYRFDFDIVLSFGLTELKAQVAWMENGREKRSPATIIYE